MTAALYNPAHTAADLLARASAVTGFPVALIRSRKRTALLCHVRWSVWLVLRDRHSWTLQSIATHFHRHHTAVIHGIRAARRLSLSDPSGFQRLVHHLSQPTTH